MDALLTSEPEFGSRVEPFRRELQVHCYRMLGTLQDAEDLVQETLLRAWQKRETLRDPSLLRAWLYKIATNACLDALDRRPKRALPDTVSLPSDPTQPPAPPRLEPIWLDPLPDAFLVDTQASPEARYTLRESVSLAFLAALNTLPPRQRAVLLLRDVLELSAEETAQFLSLTVASVNSALHRARVTISKQYHRINPDALEMRADDPHTVGLLDRYVHAWEAANIDDLLAVLQEDATFMMPPTTSWYRGKAAIGIFASGYIMPRSANGLSNLVPTRANGVPAFAWYQFDPDTRWHRAFGIQTIEITNRKISSATLFANPALFRFFDLPLALET